MATYQEKTADFAALCKEQGGTWRNINPEFAARMALQNAPHAFSSDT